MEKSILKDLFGISDVIFRSIIFRGGTVKYTSEIIEIFEIINDIKFGINGDLKI
jgi:hypothetical protein